MTLKMETPGRVRKVSETRALLEKASRRGLTASETIMLSGDLARIRSRIARVNARAGRKVAELSSYAGLEQRVSSSRAVAL